MWLDFFLISISFPKKSEGQAKHRVLRFAISHRRFLHRRFLREMTALESQKSATAALSFANSQNPIDMKEIDDTVLKILTTEKTNASDYAKHKSPWTFIKTCYMLCTCFAASEFLKLMHVVC